MNNYLTPGRYIKIYFFKRTLKEFNSNESFSDRDERLSIRDRHKSGRERQREIDTTIETEKQR